jgi:hypothetical protein
MQPEGYGFVTWKFSTEIGRDTTNENRAQPTGLTVWQTKPGTLTEITSSVRLDETVAVDKPTKVVPLQHLK